MIEKLNAKKNALPLNLSRLSSSLLNKLKIPIFTSLGETVLSTAELRNLEKGDAIKLDANINSPVLVRISDLVNLLGQPGSRKNKLAVKVVGIEEEQELELAPPEIKEAQGHEEAAPEEEITVEKEPEEKAPEELVEKAAAVEEEEELAEELEEEELEDLEDEESLDEDFEEEIEEEKEEE